MRYAHKVPEEVQSVKLEKLIPLWTVTRKVYTESLTSCYSGISNDILLFSDIVLSLAHHYRVHKKGVHHVAFRKNYMSQLRAMLPLPAAQFAQRGSPEPGCSAMEDSPDAVGGYHRASRRTFARSPTHTPGQGDTHTNCTSPDRARPAGRGGSYGF